DIKSAAAEAAEALGITEDGVQHTTVTANSADDINRALADSGSYDDPRTEEASLQAGRGLPPKQVVPPPQNAPPKDSTPPSITLEPDETGVKIVVWDTKDPSWQQGTDPDDWKRMPGQIFDAYNLQWVKMEGKRFVLFDIDKEHAKWVNGERATNTYMYPEWDIDKLVDYLPDDFNKKIKGHAWPLKEAIGIRTVVGSTGFRTKPEWGENYYYNSAIQNVWPMSEAFPDIVDSPEIPF
ncbi:hypothetical protein LCGC14_3040340, partial [marine sediment metagenome]